MKHKQVCTMCGRDSAPRSAVETMRVELAALQRTAARVNWRKAHAEWREAAWRSYQGRRQDAVEAELVQHARAVREAAR
jgi:hypothetical protein